LIAAADRSLSSQDGGKVSLVAKVRSRAGGLFDQAKVRSRAGGLFDQAKAKYASSEAAQKASKQASQTAGQVVGRLKDLAGKTSSALRSARSSGDAHR
jgi:hypothetical protein